MKQFKGKPVKMSISEEELRDLVVNQQKTDREIARLCGVCSVTAQHWRQRLGLPSPYANRKPKPLEREPKRHVNISREDLHRLYVVDGLSQREIGLKLGVTQGAVSHWLWKHDIEARPDGGRLAVTLSELTLREMYLDRKLTIDQLADHFKCGYQTVRQNLRNYGISIDAAELAVRRLDRNKIRYPQRMENRGYISLRMPDHPAADKGYVQEHRFVAENAIGRVIESGEQVHHINLQKRDNRIENLAVLPDKTMHALVHRYMERITVYLCGLTEIRPEALDFGAPVFWGGRYVTSIDLIPPGVRPASGQLALGETTSQETHKEVVN